MYVSDSDATTPRFDTLETRLRLRERRRLDEGPKAGRQGAYGGSLDGLDSRHSPAAAGVGDPGRLDPIAVP